MTTAIKIPDREELCEVVDLVTSVLLELHATPAPPHTEETAWSSDRDIWVGAIAITGAFEGVVALSCTRSFLRTAVHKIISPDEDSDEVACDLLAELTNVLGGNLKSLLSPPGSPCHLSLPVVSHEVFDVPGGELELEQWCEVGSELLLSRLWRADPTAATRSGLRVVR